MKATLEFDLDNPDDKLAHIRAVNADNVFTTLWDFDQWMRGEIKHNNKEHLQEARDRLLEIMDDNGITFDMYG